MDLRGHGRHSISSDDSVTLYLSESNQRSGSKKARRKRSRRRACPVLALVGVVLYFLSSGSGVAISVLVVKFGLASTIAGHQDIVARIILFTASCLGMLYVLLHIISARQHYVRNYASPQVNGHFIVSIAVLIARLSLLVWVATVVMNALVAAKVGLDTSRGIKGNVAWLELGIAVVALLSLAIVVSALESSERPFATSVISKGSFIKGEGGHRRQDTVDTFDMSASRAGIRADDKENGSRPQAESSEVPPAAASDDRSLIKTPDNKSVENFALWTDSPDRRPPMRRARSLAFPTPLETIFGSRETLPGAKDCSPGISRGDFSWRPPTRDSMHRNSQKQRQHVTVMYHDTLRPRSGDDDLILHYDPSAESMPVVPPPTLPHPSIMSRFPENTPRPQGRPSLVFRDTLPPPPSMAPGPPLPGVPIRERRPTLPDLADLQTPPLQQEQQQQQRRSTLPDVNDPPPEHKRRPTLPDLADLPARAAMRRRNSLLVRDADLAPNPRLSDVSKRWTAIGVLTPTASEFTEVPRPDITHREVQRDPADGSIVEGQHPLMRNASTRNRLVRNFSRPGPRFRRASTHDGDGTVRRSLSFEEGVPPDMNDTIRKDAEAINRSRSVPPQSSARSAQPSSGPPPAVPLGVTTSISVASEVSPRTSGTDNQLPFREAKPIKGLGQGSDQRLDRRVEQWQQGIPAPTVAERRGVSLFPRQPVAPFRGSGVPVQKKGSKKGSKGRSSNRRLMKEDGGISQNF